MADLNRVTLQGRFVRDPESKVAKSGTEFVTFCLACNRIPSKDTGKITADFVDIVAYGNTAKFIKQRNIAYKHLCPHYFVSLAFKIIINILMLADFISCVMYKCHR